MELPPPGYDDETVVPKERLKKLVGHIDEELKRIEVIKRQQPSASLRIDSMLDSDLGQLFQSAEEIGMEHSEYVENLINDYDRFKMSPDEEKLLALHGDIKKLKIFLGG